LIYIKEYPEIQSVQDLKCSLRVTKLDPNEITGETLATLFILDPSVNLDEMKPITI